MVSLNNDLLGYGKKCLSYIPHALVAEWTDDRTPVTPIGTQVLERREGKIFSNGSAGIRVVHRMVKREQKANRFRFLPLHLAMQGFLELFFGGPSVVWQEYSKRALSQGLGPRIEWSITGRAIPDFEDALRVFEIHDRQTGVLLFVGDTLASVFVVSHPADYVVLHRTLVEDFYGPLLYQYGLFYPNPPNFKVSIDARGISTLSDLRAELDKAKTQWAAFHEEMGRELIGRRVRAQKVYRAGPFTLQRFITDLSLSRHNHIGEAMVHDDSTLAYLKTYQLSKTQTRRIYVLEQLAAHDWNLDETAKSMALTKDQLILRVEAAEFGFLLRQDVLDGVRKRAKDERGG